MLELRRANMPLLDQNTQLGKTRVLSKEVERLWDKPKFPKATTENSGHGNCHRTLCRDRFAPKARNRFVIYATEDSRSKWKIYTYICCTHSVHALSTHACGKRNHPTLPPFITSFSRWPKQKSPNYRKEIYRIHKTKLQNDFFLLRNTSRINASKEHFCSLDV